MGSTSRLLVSRCRTLVVLLFCCGAAIKVAPQTTSKPRFNAAVNLVRITVIARDVYGKAVRNLGASDFLVTDDGRRQRIDSLVRVERDRKKGEPRGFDLAKTADSIEDGPRYSEARNSGYLVIAFDSMGGLLREDSEAKLAAGFASRYFAVQDGGPLLFPGSADSLPEQAFDAPERFVTAAIDANVALYPVDARGVVTVIPFGDATTTTGEMNPGGPPRRHNQ